MIIENQTKETLPTEISKNFQLLKGSIETHLSELELEMESLSLKDLSNQPKIVQLLYSDQTMFDEFIETFNDVLIMNENAMKKIKGIADVMKGQSQKSKLRMGTMQIKDIIFKVLTQEISEIEDDDEIKTSYDLSENKALELLTKLNENSYNKENRNKYKQQAKKVNQEEKSKKIQLEIEENAKQEKEKVMMESKTVEDKEFTQSKMTEVEVMTGNEPIIMNDCPPRLRLDASDSQHESLEKLRKETGLQILGNNKDLREVFANWIQKPMLRVLTNKSKHEIENNIKKIANLEGRKELPSEEELKKFLEQETDGVEDTLDLFDKKDYFHELYMSGSRYYRDIERRYLFPYSDSLHRFRKSHMLTNLQIFVEEIRRNLLCYEREIIKNFEVPEFYRISQDEENSSNRVLLLYIFKISELSQNKNFEMTATFFGLNRKCVPIQGTVSFAQINDFFVFEGQYVGVCGDFNKGILNVKGILPFDSKNVISNEWNVSQIETVTSGTVKIRPELKEEVEGKNEGMKGWTRSINVIKSSKHNQVDRIIEEVGNMCMI